MDVRQNFEPCTAGTFFQGLPLGQSIYRVVAEVVSSFGPAEVRVSKSQMAFRHRRGFAYLWHPGQYVKSIVTAVLSLALPRELPSPRFKEIANPSPNIWMHHLEIQDSALVDSEVEDWLREAYNSAA